MIAVVIKNTGAHRPGDLVDTTGWRNTAAMLRARQIRGAEPSEIALFEKGVKQIREAAPKNKTEKTAAKSAA